MARRFCIDILGFFLLLLGSVVVLAQTQKVAVEKGSVAPAAVAGDWQMAWTGRLGVEQCTLHLQQDGAKLTGTFKDQRGISPLSGSVDGNKITFEVQFGGPRPFTTRFTGALNGDKFVGTSKAINVDGNGAFLGHPGEVVNPEHSWTAKRAPDQSSQSSRISTSTSAPAKK